MILKTNKPLDCDIEIIDWRLYILNDSLNIRLELTEKQELAFIKQINKDVFEETMELTDLPF